MLLAGAKKGGKSPICKDAKRFFYFLPIFFCSSSLIATEGHTFPIQEKPFRPSIGSVSSVDYEKIAEQAKTPAPVQGLKEATEYRSFYFDPTYTVPEDVQDHKGNYLAREGQKIDPMEHVASLPTLIFFDGTNEDHIAWAEKHPQAKWILVKGSPVEIEELTGHATYFDQMGGFSKHFGLKNIPCTISKKDNKILIEEIPLGGQK